MNSDEFRKVGHDFVDWMSDYFENIESYPVKSQVEPGDIINQLPVNAPETGESITTIFNDFKSVIIPGMTHWQHPKFFAYFPANNSFPSILAEMLMATMGAQCMSWQTSPAATELEERVMQWLVSMLGLPQEFTGVIQDTASSATLVALLTAREQHTHYQSNEHGTYGHPPFTVYCSSQTHSSVEKAVKILGFGREYLRLIAVDDDYALKPDDLEQQIIQDKAQGLIPLCVIATIGTTSSTAIDPLASIGQICKKHQLWLHVDAAFAGTALLLPEYRWMIDGIHLVDSFVFNPHKWMFTNFDCSAYFVKDKSALLKTFEILPEFLKTKEAASVNNYRDWGIPLGRRFRALKLWFVIRNFGIQGLQQMLRTHIELAQDLAVKIQATDDFELLAPTPLNALCFRYKPAHLNDINAINRLNQKLLETLNATGQIYMTHTKLGDNYTIRLVIGQTRVEAHHVNEAWNLITKTARSMVVDQNLVH